MPSIFVFSSSLNQITEVYWKNFYGLKKCDEEAKLHQIDFKKKLSQPMGDSQKHMGQVHKHLDILFSISASTPRLSVPGLHWLIRH